MSKFIQTELELNHQFDSNTSRHYLNGQLTVLHCHHYSTLYTQLADDVEFTDGKELLKNVAEDVFYGVLENYFNSKNITNLSARVEIVQQYYSAIGLGELKVIHMGDDFGQVELIHSHLDEGWVHKWGQSDKPVNYITSGFAAAIFNLINGTPARSCTVKEVQSIVTGAEKSIFKISRN